MADDDSDDSLPPLEHVGAPVSSSATTPAPAQGEAPAAAVDQASEDSMPPLEFVGTSETPCREGLRPGDKVVLKDLSTASLNGQHGTVLPFTDAEIARKGRLGVRLDNGKQMSVKYDNLQKVEAPAATPKDDAESEDSMPPLEFVGTTEHASSSAPAAPPKNDAADEDDDDDMPPLDYVGTAPKADAKSSKPPEKEDASDDSMPPLDYAGPSQAAPQAKSAPLEKEDASDDSMPPLDYVGPSQTAPQAKAAPLEKEEASDDSMPPLDYVGPSKAAPQAEAQPVQTAAVAPAAPTTPKPAATHAPVVTPVTGGDKAESEDSMPALEYVGNSPETLREGLRPGDKVVLEGLSTASLNGQHATILPFTDADIARKGRLGVRLDSGKQMSVKRENLKKVSEGLKTAAAAVEAKDGKADAADEDDDDDMPPLDYVGTAPKADAKPGKPPEKEDASDDSMPPLDYVGSSAAPAETSKAVAPAVEATGDNASDDSMPPLESAAPAGTATRKQEVADEDDDDMPPLEYAGTAPGSAGKATAVQEKDASDDTMPPLDYVGPPQAKADDASDDSMPPLDYVGSAPKTDTGKAPLPAEQAKQDAASDDSMPPLDYVGSGPTQNAAKVEQAEEAAASDDSMPPLDYVGTGAADSTPAVQQAVPKETPAFQPGDQVVLQGLSTAALNGQQGTVVPTGGVQNGRLGIKLESGKILSIKPENLTKAAPAAAIATSKDDESDDSMPPLDYVGSAAPPEKDNKAAAESDDSMPPLDYVGSAAPAQSAEKEAVESDESMPPLDYVGSAAPAQTAEKAAEESEDSMPPLDYVGNAPAKGSDAAAPPDAAAESDDSMPPLDYVGPATSDSKAAETKPEVSSAKTAASASQPKPAFSVGNVVVLNGLSNAALNGQRAVVLALADTEESRMTVKLEKSGQKLAVKPDKVEKASQKKDDDDSCDSMPPLDYVGSAAPPSSAESKPVQTPSAEVRPAAPAKDDAASDDSMPPLDYVGSSAPQASASGKPVANPQDDAASDDSMPPLDYVGSSAPQAADSDDDMPPLEYVGNSQKPENTGTPADGDDDSHDSMPPLEDQTAPPAPASTTQAAPAKESKPAGQQSRTQAPLQTAPPQRAQGKPSAGVPSQGNSCDGFSVGSTVVLKGFKTGDLNGQRVTIVPRTKQTPKGKLEVELKNGKRMAVSFMKVDKLPDQVGALGRLNQILSTPDPGRAVPVVDSHIDNDAPASDDSLPPLEDDAGQQILKVGDTVLLKGLAKTELNGQHATITADASKESDGRLRVRLVSTGAKLAVLREKVERVRAAPTAPGAAIAKTEPEGTAAVSGSPKAAASPQDVKPSSKPATTRKATPESLLEKMKEAMQGSSEQLIMSVIDEVEANKDLNWGDLLPKKKQLLKKLRAKKRKLDGDTSAKVESEVSAAECSPAPAMKILKESQAIPEVRGSASDVSSDSKEKPWIVLNPSTTQEKAGVTIKEWCEKLELPPEVLARLEEEEVTTPDELIHVPEEDLKTIVANLKIGPKGRFLAAVKAMR